MYTCETCGYTTDAKYNYNRHLKNRKKSCRNGEEQVKCDCECFIFVKNMKKHREVCSGVPWSTCQYCDKAFKSRSGKCKHQKKCKTRRIEEQSVEEPMNITINITNHIVQNNITLNFGQENVSYLLTSSRPEIQNAIRSIVDSIDLVHFNKDHPENHTVRKLNKKSHTMEFKTGDDRWEHECCKTGIPKLRHNLKERLNVVFDDIARFSDPEIRELLYYKSKRGLVDENEIVSRTSVDTESMVCQDMCDNIKAEYFRTVSPALQTMPCVVQDLQRQLNEVRTKHKMSAWSMEDTVRYAFA